MPDIPHFAFPFKFMGSAAAVVEQDSDEELVGCCALIVMTPIGSRYALPDFGVVDPTFRYGTTITAEMRAAVQLYEPRADLQPVGGGFVPPAELDLQFAVRRK